MKAMIFAAGLGTRLRPLTNNKPKALVELNGTPLLEIAIKKLKTEGFNDIIINVHHFADLVIKFLADNNNFGANIRISHEKNQLLDTGGGLKKAAWFFKHGSPFLVYNVDILSNINLKDLYQSHIKSGALATLAVRHRTTSRYLMFDDDNTLCGWKNVKTGEIKKAREANNLHSLAFSGIQVISPRLFQHMPDADVFSSIDVYLEAAEYDIVKAYPHDKTYWMDLGKIPQLEEAEKWYKS